MGLASHTPEVVVWVPARLDGNSRAELTGALERKSGIHAATFCSKRHHLMLVQYDRHDMTSQDVLNYLRERRIDARLIGPI